MATNNTQAIQIANGLISCANQLLALYNQIGVLNTAWTDDAVANTLNAMTTVALNSDGTQGTADSTPNVAHPISLTVYPTLNRSISANQLASLNTVLGTITTLVNGSAVSAQSGFRAIINNATGG